MHDGWQRWLEEMRAKKAAGEIKRFPGGRTSGAGWVTPRMWEKRQMETMQRLRAERDALEPPPPPQRRGRPSNVDLVMQAKARIAKLRAKLESSVLLG
jgi:hypothetical protein